MNWQISLNILQLVILGMCPVVLVLLVVKGWLRRDALNAGPSRRVGLVPIDLLVVLGLMFFGPTMVVLLIPGAMGHTESGVVSDLDTLTFARRALLAQASGQLLSVLYLLWRAGAAPRGLRRIGVVPTRPWRDLWWGGLGFFAAVPMIMAAILIAVFVGERFGQETPVLAHDMLKMLVDSDSMTGTALIIVSAVLVAPVLEESVFRGAFQSVLVETLGERRRWTAVITASIVFMFMHADPVNWENWQALPGLLVLGLVLGWLYERSGSLWPSIIVHVGFNAMNIMLALATTLTTEPTQ